MLHVRAYPFELAFEYPFTISKGTKTLQPTLIVSLGLGNIAGFGEAPAITYYNVSVPGMMAILESKRPVIERFALTDPERFWHFLHHLIPGEHFLTAALDIAGWDLFAKLKRQPLRKLLGINDQHNIITDYTIGIASADEMVGKMQHKPWPLYKIKLGTAKDIDLLIALRAHTNAPFRIDANEGWTFEETKQLLPELKKLNVTLVEQPLHREQFEEMRELKSISSIPLFADEACRTEEDVQKCADSFHGINIKLTKCSGITPALRMIKQARTLGLQVMMGSMNESTIGSAAIATLMPLLDAADADGPLLLKEDVATGLIYNPDGSIQMSNAPGLGVQFYGRKIERARQ